MKSPHLGAYDLTIEGRTYTVCFPIRALAKVQGAFGVGVKLSELLDGVNPETLLKLLEIGLEKHHGPDAFADIADAVIPLVPLRNALVHAINFAMVGPAALSPQETAGEPGGDGAAENPPQPKAI